MIPFWIGFLLLIFFLLALDLGIFNKRAHVIKAKEALLWTFFYIILALLFSIFIYFAYKNHWLGIGLQAYQCQTGHEAALAYFTGYVIEKSLSLDNIFVMAVIFSYFQVAAIYQHRVLFWGILGALVLRGMMIFIGTALIQKFSWMIMVFGALLIITAVRMLISKDEKFEPEKNLLIRTAKKLYPVTDGYVGAKFFVKQDNVRLITPLFLVLLVIESTDLLFAIDSIPAIFAITSDPYIVFTSNVFAILGLRSLYFALAAMMKKFRYLKISLVFILSYVGFKMILSHYVKINTIFSLAVIVTILIVGVLTSMEAGRKDAKKLRSSLK